MDNQSAEQTSPPVQTVPPVQPTPPVTPPPSKSFLSGKLIILIVILLIIFAGGGAYFVLNSQNKPVPTVSKAMPTSIPTPTTDPTASWKTYENKTFNYSIKYPPVLIGEDGRIDEIYNGNASIEYFKKPISAGSYPHQIGLYLASRSQNIDEYIGQIATGDGPPPQLQTAEINVGNVKGKKVIGVPSANGEILILLPHPNSGIFAIVLNPYIQQGDNNEKEWIKSFDKILSTFKFTPASPTGGDANQTIDTSSWKTYTNTKGKYTLKYPPISIFTEDTNGNATGNLSNNKVVIATEPVALSLNNYIDQKTWCINISSTTGKAFNLDSENSLRFDKTPCGSTGSTDIYSVHNGIAYHIFIETQENFNTVQPIFDQILSTFKFTQ